MIKTRQRKGRRLAPMLANTGSATNSSQGNVPLSIPNSTWRVYNNRADTSFQSCQGGRGGGSIGSPFFQEEVDDLIISCWKAMISIVLGTFCHTWEDSRNKIDLVERPHSMCCFLPKIILGLLYNTGSRMKTEREQLVLLLLFLLFVMPLPHTHNRGVRFRIFLLNWSSSEYFPETTSFSSSLGEYATIFLC